MTPEEHADLNARIDALQARVDALITRLDSMLANEPEDPTQRIVPIPEHMLPHLPPLPERKTKWVGRGSEWARPSSENSIPTGGRVVYYWTDEAFIETTHFSGFSLFHIEAV
jgi:hypothetical protein